MSQQWMSREGPIRIHNMTDKHLLRSIQRCKERISIQGNIIYNNRRTKSWIKLFKKELQQRKNKEFNTILKLTYPIY